MYKLLLPKILCLLVSVSLSMSGALCQNDAQLSDLQKAEITMAAVYEHYKVNNSVLLRENYPYFADYRADYVSEDQSKHQNEYSFLWPYSGSFSAGIAIARRNPRFLETVESRILNGLNLYYDTVRLPHAYSSYIVSQQQSDRYYDDNLWIGIDFCDLYELTGKRCYLESAKAVWQFIESGCDDTLGGGIYWCEASKKSKNTCSTAPAVVMAAKLYGITKEKHYLDSSRRLYAWTREHLLDTSDGLYYDHLSVDGRIDKRKFAYNSGQMIQAAALLYGFTGEKGYLDDAHFTAAGCGKRFFDDEKPDGTQRLVLRGGNIWFDSIMLRGLAALYAIDGDDTYLRAVKSTLNMAWRCNRSSEGLFGNRYAGAIESRKPRRYWLLTQFAMAAMYAQISEMNINETE